MEYLKKEILEELVYYRKATGMSQNDLARRLGINRSAISRKESGEFEFTIDQFLEYVDELGLEMVFISKRKSRIYR